MELCDCRLWEERAVHVLVPRSTVKTRYNNLCRILLGNQEEQLQSPERRLLDLPRRQSLQQNHGVLRSKHSGRRLDAHAHTRSCYRAICEVGEPSDTELERGQTVSHVAILARLVKDGGREPSWRIRVPFEAWHERSVCAFRARQGQEVLRFRSPNHGLQQQER